MRLTMCAACRNCDIAFNLGWSRGRQRWVARFFSALTVSLKLSRERGIVWTLDRKSPSPSFAGLPDSIVDTIRLSGTSDWGSGRQIALTESSSMSPNVRLSTDPEDRRSLCISLLSYADDKGKAVVWILSLGKPEIFLLLAASVATIHWQKMWISLRRRSVF